LGRFASGVTVVTALHAKRTHAMTANAFVSVSLDPPLVLVSLDNRSYMHKILPTVRRYGISVLAEDQEHVSDHFAGRIVDAIHIRFVGHDRIPLLDGAVAHYVVHVIDVHPAGDHTLYIGQVEYFETYDRRPLLFYASQYRQLSAKKIQPTAWPQDEFSLFSIGPMDPSVISDSDTEK